MGPADKDDRLAPEEVKSSQREVEGRDGRLWCRGDSTHLVYIFTFSTHLQGQVCSLQVRGRTVGFELTLLLFVYVFVYYLWSFL